MTSSTIAQFEAQSRAERSRASKLRAIVSLIFCLCFIVSAWVGEVSPSALASGLWEAADYFWRMVPALYPPTFRADLENWYWGFGGWASALMDTVLIAFISTTIAVVVATPLSFLSSRNLSNGLICLVVRRTLEFMRTVPTLVYALAFVLAFGLGATAGVLAISVHASSSLGKLFSEINETISDKPLESVRSSGGGWAALIRFGVLPQVAPNYVSYILLRFEKNIRSATVIGFVGAGGIGQELFIAIRSFQYQDVSAIVLMIIGTVVLTDLACERLRRAVT